MTADLDDAPDAALAALGRVLSGLADLAEVPAWQVGDDALARCGRRAGPGGPARLGAAAAAGRRGRRPRAARQGGHARLEHWIREQVPTTARGPPRHRPGAPSGCSPARSRPTWPRPATPC